VRKAPTPGTVADLVARFRVSPRFNNWAASTKKMNDAVLCDFVEANGKAPVASLRRGQVLAMRDSMSRTPGAANNWMKVIRALLQYAVDLEMVRENVAAKIPKLPPEQPDGFRSWREDEIEAFCAYYRPDTLPHRAMALMLYTGAAASDVVRLGPGNLRGERIVYRRNKTGASVDVPILPPLAEALRWSTGMTFLETVDGRVRSSYGLGNQMREWTRKAGLGAPDEHGRLLGCHGLRKALGRRLAEAGCTPHELQAWLGHDDLKSVMIYTKFYDRGRATDSAAVKMGAAVAPKVVRLRRKE
jgi:integrase